MLGDGVSQQWQINDHERYLLCGVVKIVILNWEA